MFALYRDVCCTVFDFLLQTETVTDIHPRRLTNSRQGNAVVNAFEIVGSLL